MSESGLILHATAWADILEDFVKRGRPPGNDAKGR